MYEPTMLYVDISICNVIGVYKTGQNNITQEGLFERKNKYLSSLAPKKELLQQKINKFGLYPNPASTTITIAYELNQNEKGNVIVYDILGREQMIIDLDYMANRVSVNISSFTPGLYTYKYLVNNVQKETGKLLIEK